VEIEKRTAHLYMTYLATYLSSKLDSVPITNSLAILNEPLPWYIDTSRLRVEPLHTVTAELQDALPVPTVELSARTIADFKRAHQAELESFKLTLDNELFAAAEKDPAELTEYSNPTKRFVLRPTRRLQAMLEGVEQFMTDETFAPIRKALWGVIIIGVAAAGAYVGLDISPSTFGAATAVVGAIFETRRLRQGSTKPVGYGMKQREIRRL
jgi:hypothetical protein